MPRGRQAICFPSPQQWAGAQKRLNNSNLAGWKEGEVLSRKLPGDGVTRQSKEGGVTGSYRKKGLEHSCRFRKERRDGAQTETRQIVLHPRVILTIAPYSPPKASRGCSLVSLSEVRQERVLLPLQLLQKPKGRPGLASYSSILSISSSVSPLVIESCSPRQEPCGPLVTYLPQRQEFLHESLDKIIHSANISWGGGGKTNEVITALGVLSHRTGEREGTR